MMTTIGPRLATRAMLVLASALAGCERPASGNDDPWVQPPEPARFDRPAMVRFHMQRHFDDLRRVERALVSGKLADGKALAFLLTRPAPDPGMARWAAEIDDVTSAARALAAAPGTDEALRRAARVAEACARCHLATQKRPVFPVPPAAPGDAPDPAVRMARHQWAVDRLWEGIVAGSDAPWRAGLEILAATPPPVSALTDAPALAAQLQRVARGALVRHADGSETLDGRARYYGEMLVACAACHVSTGKAAPGR